MADEVVNFGAGPAKLPREVLVDLQKEMIQYGSTGVSVMEMSHRSPAYEELHNKTLSLIRELLNVPPNYKILLMHGGGRGAFAAVALNLLPPDGVADYIVTGLWSGIAAKDAENIGKVNYVLKLDKRYGIPDPSSWNRTPNASYLFYCDNETADGFEFPFVPDSQGVPLVCDMSSSIMTKPIDVSKFAVIFAAVQKNIGPAGVTVVIVRDDLIGDRKPHCPAILDFSVVNKENSIMNTPATYTIYTCGKVLEHMKKQGGIRKAEKLSKIKSDIIYNLIDDSNGFYTNEVHPKFRSRINITFRVQCDPELEKKFVKLAEQAGLVHLKGHRSVGGIRASLYSAITVEEVGKLAGFMRVFMNEHSFRKCGKV